MSVEFTIDELRHLHDNFKKHDRNKDRKLSRRELLHLVQEEITNATDHEVDWFLAMIVHNKDAIHINFAQYVRGMSEFAKIGTRLEFPSKSLHSLVASGLLTLDFSSKRGLNWREVDRIYTQFERADENNSGTISRAEMAKVFQKVTPEIPETAYPDIFDKIDTNSSGFVDFVEFLEWVISNNINISLSKPKLALTSTKRKLVRESSNKTLKPVKLRTSIYSLKQAQEPVLISKNARGDAYRAFAAMDSNGDGELSESEFCTALQEVLGKNLTNSDLNRLYYLVDSDRSGSISYEEFLYAVAHQAEVLKLASTMKYSYFPSKFEWEIPYEELQIETKIGEGNFGVVYKGKWHGTPVAIKKLKYQTLTEEILDDFKKEASIMARLRHPNIVLFMGACTQPNNLCIVTEYLSEGNVYSLLHKRNKRLAPQGIKKIAHQVALGLNYLHKHGIVHRDLKSLNLLMDDNHVCKLCDFGLSCLKQKADMLTEQVGSPLWMSPELLINKPYSEKVDIYSYAICIWECLTNRLPFDDLSFSELVRAVSQQGTRPDIPGSCDATLSTLVRQCWDTNPDNRPNVDSILCVLEKI